MTQLFGLLHLLLLNQKSHFRNSQGEVQRDSSVSIIPKQQIEDFSVKEFNKKGPDLLHTLQPQGTPSGTPGQIASNHIPKQANVDKSADMNHNEEGHNEMVSRRKKGKFQWRWKKGNV